MGSSNSTLDGQEIPKTMRRLVLASGPTSDIAKVVIQVQEVDTPTPKPGQVLVRVAAAPVNPSDYGKWTKGTSAGEPEPIGNEGSGVVVAVGGGFSTMGLLGKKVGFVNLPRGQGSYSEYVTVDVMKGAFQLPSDLNVEDAASFFVNPYTAYGILDTAKSSGAKAYIHTAAASQLGQMLVKLHKQDEGKGVTLINVVRREDQAKILRDLGAENIVNTADSDWKAQLKSLIDKTGCRLAFDAVGGPMTGDLIGLLPNEGKVWVYGVLGGPVSGVNGVDLIYFHKQIEGFLLTRYLLAGNMVLSALPRIRHVTARVASGLQNGWSKTEFKDTTPETMFKDFMKLRTDEGFTNKKLRIRFN